MMMPRSRRRRPRLTTPVVVLLGALLPLLAACGHGSGPTAGPASGPAGNQARSRAAGSATTPAAGSDQIYVSIGDSYAAGFQATGVRAGHTTRNGFAYQLVDAARAKNYHLRLINFGCGGATTSSLLTTAGCRARNLGPDAAPYDGTTQAAAAASFLRRERGRVGLVTVSIGGNDVVACIRTKNPPPCLAGAVTTIRTNLGTLLARIRGAVGPDVPVVGITYPDVILAGYLSTSPGVRALAMLSVTAFKSLINPALKTTYQSAGAIFVDVTAASGAYGPLTQKTNLAPYGQLPVPVAKVCQLTFICQYQDIHPRTNGYTLITNLIVGALPLRRAG